MKNAASLLPSSAATARERHLALNRRQFLRGVGVCLTLPVFESALPGVLKAATAPGAVGATGGGAPLRLAFVYVPNGANLDLWRPVGEGANFAFGKTMEPLAALKHSVQVLSGLDHKNASPGNDGTGDHARATATFLTGARARKTASADIHLGPSIDQLAAQRVGHLTRFSSLELTCDAVRKSGACDIGYSCAYQYNLSWASANTPVTPEANPRLVFERLFGAGSPAERQQNFQRRQATQKSLLDLVVGDARAMQRELGYHDRQKLDAYLTSVRELETRLERSESFGALPIPAAEAPPTGLPADYGEHMDLMFDLMTMAFQTDSTRIATLMLSADGSNRPFPQIGIPEGHHFCSHHRNEDELLSKIARIDLYYMQHLARFLQRLDQTKDIDGRSLLQNSMIVYGSGDADGNKHSHDDLPVILAGGGGGTLRPGQHLNAGGRPMSDLFLSLADRMGVPSLERIGDSSGRLALI